MPTEPSPDTQAAIELALASKAPATVRAYEADWRHFTAWCASRGHTPLPAQPTVIAAYLAAHARGVGGVERLKTSTLQRRMAAVGAYHTANYLPNPCKSPEVQATWHGIRRELGWSKNRAAPATTSVLRQLADTCDTERYIGLRDLAVYRAVQSAARRAGLETPLRYRGHSLRAGAAVQAGPVATDQELMAAGGWASLEVVRSYTGSTRIWEDPVAGRLGL